MPYKIQIHEVADEVVQTTGDSFTAITEKHIFSQTVDEINLDAIYAAINQKPRKRRKSKVATLAENR